ncbi:aldehyde dehydrogenase family protein [Actinomarinicola tropica]|uniref:Aldehyde dehydrogenase family protein n=1 Tax=Actinomarinicola tropica TaxID=2789776 RepID=A0A5Q2RKP2_9ACTN|nr:aldehyde dehydrogenase family protein [Actinomarinicola tropica]QGG96054.1 aldehyde dehydrogenase family protein [Actinomarinicola tropica]
MTDRLDVRKTYKLYVAGAFPRSESGRTYDVTGPDGTVLAHAPLASRKDARDAVGAARGAQASWAGRTAYNRAQILYRIAEMLEGRRAQFVDELGAAGAEDAATEVDAAVDRWVWYAGWADKIAQVAGSANPVAGPYFNLSVPEPSGVVVVVAPDAPALLGLVSRVAPAILAGNTTVVVASETSPLPALTFGEVLATSDLPDGVVNVLSGRRAELVPPLAGHRDVDVLDLLGVDDDELRADARRAAADAVTRTVRERPGDRDWLGEGAQHPELILASCEVKTVWHPKGR